MINNELKRVTEEFIENCLGSCEDAYQEIKTTLLVGSSKSECVRNNLKFLFDYIDEQRPKLIEMH